MWKLLKLKWVMKLGLILATCCVTCSRNCLLSGVPATWLHTSLRGFVFLRWKHCLFSFSPYVCVIEILINVMSVLDDDVPSVLIFCLWISQSIPGSFSLFLYSSPRGRSVWLLHAHRSHCEPGCWCDCAESPWTAPSPQTRCKSWLPLAPDSLTGFFQRALDENISLVLAWTVLKNTIQF